MNEQNTQIPDPVSAPNPVSEPPVLIPDEPEGIDTRFKIIAGVLAAAVLALGIFLIWSSGGEKESSNEAEQAAEETARSEEAPEVTEGLAETLPASETATPDPSPEENAPSITSQSAVNIDYEISQLDNQLGEPDEDDFKEDQLSESNVGL